MKVRVVPYILLAVAIYAVDVYLVHLPFDTVLFDLGGAGVGFTLSDGVVFVAIVMLLVELLLAASSFGLATNANHLLTLLGWGGCIVVFSIAREFRTPTFLLITLCMTVDIVAGIWVTMRLAPRYVSVGRTTP